MAARSPPDGTNWVHETKFDGYRVQALVEYGVVRLLTRNAHDWTPRFGKVVAEFAALKVTSAVIDCEAVVIDEHGVSRFANLQAELRKGKDAHIQMMAFDLLHLNGRSLIDIPLRDRKQQLEALLQASPLRDLLRVSQHMSGDGSEILRLACALNLEGIVSKRIDLPYRSGRNGEWVKTKCVKADPFVVIGYVPSKAAGDIVGSLVLAFYERGEFIYAGRVGTGFSMTEARAMADGFARIHTKSAAPAETMTRLQRDGVRWIQPRLVAQVRYRDVTADRVLRHASFVHFREDKSPRSVKRPAPFAIGEQLTIDSKANSEANIQRLVK